MDDIVKRGKTKRILDILADYFSVYTDEELAEKLGLLELRSLNGGSTIRFQKKYWLNIETYLIKTF